MHDYIFKGFNQPLLGSFIIPVGDLIDKLAEERYRETAAIQRIIDDLDRIIRGEGVTSYSLQAESPNQTEETTTNERMTMLATVKEEIKKAKSSIKVDDDMKKPLLLEVPSEDEEDKDEDQKRKDLVFQMMSPRGNNSRANSHRSMVSGSLKDMSAKERRSTLANPLKAVSAKVDKFTQGNKTEELSKLKAE